ncbi:peptide chain release factor family protein [Polaromonas sp. LjRoot131]|uniref:peptide chain release factor family protein n=1 Tax=Polaromonas sp. LjRoot131 TaxID=3342262 RepID=UPI003ECD45E5
MSNAYIVMRPGFKDASSEVQSMLRQCLLTIQEASLSAEIIDEQFREHTADLTGFALKASGPVAYETLRPLMPKLQDDHPGLVTVQLVNETVDAEVNLSELQVAYFRKERAVDSKFVVHGDNCAKLTHSATGLVARSTWHRSRAANYKEALALMQSLLAARSSR